MTTERYQPPDLKEKIQDTTSFHHKDTKCPFDILVGSYKHNCMQRDLLHRWDER